MAQFIDRTGKPHQLAINYGTAIALKQSCDLDLPACLLDPEKLVAILTQLRDPIQVIASLAVILKAESPEQLHELFDGDSLAAAGEALVEAIIDFFPAAQRTILQRLVKSVKQYQETTVQRAVSMSEKAIDKMDWSTVLAPSAIHGNGLSGSVVVSGTTAVT